MSTDKTSEDSFGDQCDWVTHELLTREATESSKANSLDREAFYSKYGKDPSLWSRASQSVHRTLRAIGWPITLKNHVLQIEGEHSARRYDTRFFHTGAQSKAKRAIGRLVALYLMCRQDRRVLLGSGSTVWHVGVMMAELGQYEQLFWTVNIAMASYWCEFKSPVSEVQIPEGILDTKTFRYRSMQRPTWYPPIVVVGADGCVYNARTKEATLYANHKAVGDNTNLFIENAYDSVVVCVTSDKLKYLPRQNAGEPIKPPSDENVLKLLVTDKHPKEGEDQVVQALKTSGWKIITAVTDWPDVEMLLKDLKRTLDSKIVESWPEIRDIK